MPYLAFVAEGRAPTILASRSAVRTRILGTIQAQPGMTLSDLVTLLGLGWGSVYLHLQALEKEGAVTVQHAGRRRILFAGDAHSPPEAALLRGRSARVVAEAVLERPGVDVLGICDATGLSPRAVYYHVRRLAMAGLVESQARTRHAALQPTEGLRGLLRAP